MIVAHTDITTINGFHAASIPVFVDTTINPSVRLVMVVGNEHDNARAQQRVITQTRSRTVL